jgi:hypothetical protein
MKTLKYIKNMKSLYYLLIPALMLAMASFSGCEKEKNKLMYIMCENAQENYLDTVILQGQGYLFLDSVPSELANNMNVGFIVYYQGNNRAEFRLLQSTAVYTAEICNFPDYAKQWNIPSQGKAIVYKGDFYETGRYLSEPSYIGGNLVLTIFKNEEL